MSNHCVKNPTVPSLIAEGNSKCWKVLSRHDVGLPPSPIKNVTVAWLSNWKGVLYFFLFGVLANNLVLIDCFKVSSLVSWWNWWFPYLGKCLIVGYYSKSYLYVHHQNGDFNNLPFLDNIQFLPLLNSDYYEQFVEIMSLRRKNQEHMLRDWKS